MKTNRTAAAAVRVPLTLMALAFVGSVAAQPQMNPRDQADPKVRSLSCAQVAIDWNIELISQYPRIPEACHEVITSNGVKWARFEANFVRVNRDGSVTSDFRGPKGGSMGRFTLQPGPNQMVNLSGRKVEFSALESGQLLNMYVPEGQDHLAFEPAVTPEQRARILSYEAPVEQAPMVEQTPAPAPEMPVRQGQVARVESASVVRLPDTAGPLPWFALGGGMALFGALGLRLGRRQG